jgi:hypothetical protein
MARTKDPMRHADLAVTQVQEALELVTVELDKVDANMRELKKKRDELGIRRQQLYIALEAFVREGNENA